MNRGASHTGVMPGSQFDLTTTRSPQPVSLILLYQVGWGSKAVYSGMLIIC